MTADDRWYFLQLLVWRWEWSFILHQFRKLKALLFLFNKTMKFLILLILKLVTSESLALFGIFLESNCNSGRDCRPVTKRECVSPPCFLFFGKYRTTTISQGKCINFDNGPSCRGFPFNGKYSLYWIIMPQLHHTRWEQLYNQKMCRMLHRQSLLATGNWTCKLKQDGSSLESSSYLNVTLRYLSPWGPWVLGTLGPWYSWTWTPITSSYLLILCCVLLPPITYFWRLVGKKKKRLVWYNLVWFGLVWYGMVWYGMF